MPPRFHAIGFSTVNLKREQGTRAKPRPHLLRHGVGLHCGSLQLALQQGRNACRDLRRGFHQRRERRRAPDRARGCRIFPSRNFSGVAGPQLYQKSRLLAAHHAAHVGPLRDCLELVPPEGAAETKLWSVRTRDYIRHCSLDIPTVEISTLSYGMLIKSRRANEILK